MSKILNGFLNLLRPSSPWDWLLYIIAILALICLLLQGKKGTLSMTVLLSIVIVCAIVDKANGVAVPKIYPPSGFTSFVVHILMFVSPTVVAGMTRAPKSRGWAIGAAVFAAVYLFGFWFVNQRV